jgi:hypothetical protein
VGSARWNDGFPSGIHALDGDSLKLCYKYVKDAGTTRPNQFKTDDKAGTNFVFITLKREHH